VQLLAGDKVVNVTATTRATPHSQHAKSSATAQSQLMLKTPDNTSKTGQNDVWAKSNDLSILEKNLTHRVSNILTTGSLRIQTPAQQSDVKVSPDNIFQGLSICTSMTFAENE